MWLNLLHAWALFLSNDVLNIVSRFWLGTPKCGPVHCWTFYFMPTIGPQKGLGCTMMHHIGPCERASAFGVHRSYANWLIWLCRGNAHCQTDGFLLFWQPKGSDSCRRINWFIFWQIPKESCWSCKSGQTILQLKVATIRCHFQLIKEQIKPKRHRPHGRYVGGMWGWWQVRTIQYNSYKLFKCRSSAGIVFVQCHS